MVDVHDGSQWRVQMYVDRGVDGVPDPAAVARQVAERYDLEPGGGWQVRVYAGYNRYDNLLTALGGEDFERVGERGEHPLVVVVATGAHRPVVDGAGHKPGALRRVLER